MSLVSQIGLLATSVGTTIKALTARVTALEAKTIPSNVQTGTSYTLVAGDAGKAVQMSNASANTVTLDASVFAVGSVGLIRQTGAGQTTVAAASGTTIIKGGPTLKTAQKGSMLSWRCDSSTLIYVNGECAAS